MALPELDEMRCNLDKRLGFVGTHFGLYEKAIKHIQSQKRKQIELPTAYCSSFLIKKYD